MSNLLRVQNKSALSLGSVTLTICLLGKLTTRLTGYSKRLIVKMACLTVKDIEAALNMLNTCLSVRDRETLACENSRPFSLPARVTFRPGAKKDDSFRRLVES